MTPQDPESPSSSSVAHDMESASKRVLTSWRSRAEREFPSARMQALRQRLIVAAESKTPQWSGSSTAKGPGPVVWLKDLLNAGPQIPRRMAVFSGLAATVLVGLVTTHFAARHPPTLVDSLRAGSSVAPMALDADRGTLEAARHAIGSDEPGPAAMAMAAQLMDLRIAFILQTQPDGSAVLRFAAATETRPALRKLYDTFDIDPTPGQAVVITVSPR
jgi:hypothetical protein